MGGWENHSWNPLYLKERGSEFLKFFQKERGIHNFPIKREELAKLEVIAGIPLQEGGTGNCK